MVGYLKDHAKTVPAMQTLTDKERLTLADYLSFHMPLPANQVPANLASTDGRVLPMDGRDFDSRNARAATLSRWW